MTLARCNFAVTDLTGIVQDGCSILVQREAPGMSKPQLFSDKNGENALGNPFTAADGGDAGFYCEAGFYRVTASKSGFSREWKDEPVGTSQGFDLVEGAYYQNVSIRPDAFVPLIADRDAYDDEDAGFTVVVMADAGNQDLPTIYAKLTSASADWSDGITWVPPNDGLAKVRCVATSNVAISTALENGDTIDGVTLATGDLVLLSAQSTASQNGVYEVPASGAASRSDRFASFDSLAGNFFSVMEGTTNADTLWQCTSNPGGTIDSTTVTVAKVPVGGDVVGPASVTANRIALFDTTTGKLLKQHSLGAGDMTDFNLADQGTAEGGVSNATGMSPLRTAQAIAALAMGMKIASVVASNHATVDFDASNAAAAFNGTYKRLLLICSKVKPVSDDVEAWLRIGTGAGPTYQTSGYQWVGTFVTTGGGNAGGNASDAKIIMSRASGTADVGNATGENYDARIEFDAPNAADFLNIKFQAVYNQAAASAILELVGAGMWATAGAVTAIRFMFESGNVASGTFTLYGFND